MVRIDCMHLVKKRPPIWIVHPLARNAITGHCLCPSHDCPIISWVTGTLQYNIRIYVDSDFAVSESDIVSEISLTE
jgi:hypothetical protein